MFFKNFQAISSYLLDTKSILIICTNLCADFERNSFIVPICTNSVNSWPAVIISMVIFIIFLCVYWNYLVAKWNRDYNIKQNRVVFIYVHTYRKVKYFLLVFSCSQWNHRLCCEYTLYCITFVQVSVARIRHYKIRSWISESISLDGHCINCRCVSDENAITVERRIQEICL